MVQELVILQHSIREKFVAAVELVETLEMSEMECLVQPRQEIG